MGTEKKIWVITAAFLALFAYGVWNLFTPDSFPISFIRGEAKKISDNVIIGPYPSRDEMVILKRNGVAEIVSLMDPANPIEAPLIEAERGEAKTLGIAFSTHPMDFKDMNGSKSLEELNKAVLFVKGGQEGRMYYVHCYLGRHRVAMFGKAFLEGPARAE